MVDPKYIRNFCIIAHIDHGKSTLADRLLEFTKTITAREFRDQILDAMDLERERGITIKAHPVKMNYRSKDGNEYILNLIDTPGHVDFSYEVSRSLSACEGVILLVDAAQGVEAQTVSNIHLALEQGLEIIPAINKIDLPNADLPKVFGQLDSILGVFPEDIFKVSAKTGEGVEGLLEAVVERVPAPKLGSGTRLRALIFDSFFDSYKGVIVYVRVFEGSIRPGMKILMMATGQVFEIIELGHFRMKLTPTDILQAGDVGYIAANIKSAQDIRVGDTLTAQKDPAVELLPGFKRISPMVFCGLYPVSVEDYDLLKNGIHKLKLNDASFNFEPEDSAALGFGFRCGFLGLLHMEVVQQRLEREFDVHIIATSPSVIYKVLKVNGEELLMDNPVKFPSLNEIEWIEEPLIEATIITPVEFIGAVMQLGVDYRGTCVKTESLDQTRVMMTFEIPLNEILTEFYDRLKSITKGYASLDYEHKGYQVADLVKVDVMINGDIIDAFSVIVHESKAEAKCRQLAKKLKEVIPKQLIQIVIQTAVNGRVVARETVSALKKDVTAKCYGGDITRKRKLWEKQKEGKKKMKMFGKVQIPQKAFLDVLRAD
ncbi:MAG: elongation factor 4 [Chlamydiae bacterium]|nr:elongation factor 4 [Chlamydiota bacterium]MBI3277061.1 elongation factor 4 [Chlamydiota bacterium]